MSTNRAVIRIASSFAVCVITVLGAAAPAGAQTASALFREGQPLPGGPPGHNVSAINNPAVNHNGGFAANVNTSDGTTTLSHIWGNAAGGPGTVLRTEGTFGIFTQTSYESFYGFSDAGHVAYSPLVNGGVVSSADSVWLDDTPVAVEGYAHPTLAGQFWAFGSRPGVTADGVPYFGGGITNTSGGSTQNRGLFYGTDGGTVLLLGGQTPPNLPGPLSMTLTNPSFDFRFSALGTHYIAQVTMTGQTSATDTAMVIDGSGLLIGGSLVQEGTPIPAAAGGLPGENWQFFDYTGINQVGDYFFTGDSSLATTADEYILKNGTVLYRDGMVLDGETLQGDIEGAYMNEDGDIVFIWDVQANTIEALYLNDQLVIKESDLVDLDGDGVVEANSHLANFTGISSVVVSDRDANGMVDIYFVADIDVLGTTTSTDDIEGFFRISASAGAVAVDIVAANPPTAAGNPYVPGQPYRDVLDTGTGNALTAGIGGAGTQPQGNIAYAQISVTFSGTPSPAPSTANTSISCTGASCPTIMAVSGSGVGPYAITLSGVIPPTHCTTLMFAGTNAGQKLQYQSLPADTNLDGSSNTVDLLWLVQRLNDGSANQAANWARYNINRSTESPPVNTTDLLRLVQLLNGVNTTQVFNGATAAACP